MAKDLGFVMLLDCYGEFLTERQKKVMELYYGEDLSLGEISELSGITRQAVRDSIKRSEDILLNMEEKLKFAERLSALREKFAEIDGAAERMAENAENPALLLENCSKIRENVQEGLHLL